MISLIGALTEVKISADHDPVVREKDDVLDKGEGVGRKYLPEARIYRTVGIEPDERLMRVGNQPKLSADNDLAVRLEHHRRDQARISRKTGVDVHEIRRIEAPVERAVGVNTNYRGAGRTVRKRDVSGDQYLAVRLKQDFADADAALDGHTGEKTRIDLARRPRREMTGQEEQN